MTSESQEVQGTPEELRQILEEASRAKIAPKKDGWFIREDQAQVRINMWYAGIPRETVDAATFIGALQAEFGSQLDLSALLQGVPANAQANVSIDAAWQHAVTNDRQVVFIGGRLTSGGGDRITPIESCSFSQQWTTATVCGSSAEAEYVCRRIPILLWRSLGIDRKWQELEPFVEAMAYTTGTVVDLGTPLINLFDSRFRSFIAEDIEADGALGHKMGYHANRRIGGQSERVIVNPERLNFVVSLYDQVSGDGDECSIELVCHTRGDRGRSRIKFRTELPTPLHNQLVEKLIARFA